MHLNRWLTAIIAIPVLIYLIGPGPRWAFYVLVYAVSLVGMIEFYDMMAPDLSKFVRYSMYFLTLLLFIVIYKRQISLALIVISLCAFVPMTFFMLTRPSASKEWAADISKAVLGPIYVGLPLAMLVMIDLLPNGNIWIFFLLAVIFANDTGSFYFGRIFGRHKLYEAISPKKTWEGAIGGLLSSLAVAFIFLNILAPYRPDLNALILVPALSIAGQIGDLAESMLKRNCGVKDSGRLLPGHGGVLDRIDGILFSIPVFYLYLLNFQTAIL